MFLNKKPKIMISAGETSGDLHAANMIKDLKKQGFDPILYGMGGPRLFDQGMELIVNCKEMAVIGIVEVLIQYRKIIKKLKELQQRLISDPPDILILVDYQDFNMRLAETGKQNGIKVLFYIGPQIWAWRPERVKKIASRVDLMAVIFPFEVEFYKQAHIPVEYVGHPLLNEVRPTLDKKKVLNKFNLNASKPIVTLLPGSRTGEIKRNLPVILKSCQLILKSEPNVQFVLVKALSINDDQLGELLSKYDLNIIVINKLTYDALNIANTVITSSGTATLETGLLAKPMVILYKLNWLTYAIMKHMITIKNIGLVNIVAGKQIVKEFLQGKATAKNISRETLHILTDKSYRDNMIKELSKIKPIMSGESVNCTISDCVKNLLK